MLDIGFGLLIALSALWGLWRGLVKETLALLTWVVAILSALHGQHFVLPYLPEHIATEGIREAIAFIAIFISVFAIGMLLRYLIRMLLIASGIGIIDRLLGGLFGFIRGALICSVIIALCGIVGIGQSPLWEQSLVRAELSPITQWMQSYFVQKAADNVAFINQYSRG